jgi:trehalose-6-phosphate synthase
MHQGLTMPEEQRKKRADALRALVKGSGVHEWFSRQLDDALSTRVQSMNGTVTVADRDADEADTAARQKAALATISLGTSESTSEASTTPAPTVSTAGKQS